MRGPRESEGWNSTERAIKKQRAYGGPTIISRIAASYALLRHHRLAQHGPCKHCITPALRYQSHPCLQSNIPTFRRSYSKSHKSGCERCSAVLLAVAAALPLAQLPAASSEWLLVLFSAASHVVPQTLRYRFAAAAYSRCNQSRCMIAAWCCHWTPRRRM